MSSSAASRPVVVDANLALGAVLPLPYSPACLRAFQGWAEADRVLVAPAFWAAEAVSGIRKVRFLGLVSKEAAETAVEDLFGLGVELQPLERSLSQAALRWADRLGQAKAYDGFYLALAEARKGELWTVDGRLARRARQLDAERVFHLDLEAAEPG